VPAHQALVGTEADSVAIQSPEAATQEEVAELEPIGADDPTSAEPGLVAEDEHPLEPAVVPAEAAASEPSTTEQEAQDEA
jgi:hypothetical protein